MFIWKLEAIAALSLPQFQNAREFPHVTFFTLFDDVLTCPEATPGLSAFFRPSRPTFRKCAHRSMLSPIKTVHFHTYSIFTYTIDLFLSRSRLLRFLADLVSRTFRDIVYDMNARRGKPLTAMRCLDLGCSIPALSLSKQSGGEAENTSAWRLMHSVTEKHCTWCHRDATTPRCKHENSFAQSERPLWGSSVSIC